MSRDDLRKVEFIRNNKIFLSSYPPHKPTKEDILEGWFHEWEQTGDENGNSGKFALVEDITGLVFEIQSHKIRFIDS